jgi:4-diphosphocytidyl-2-C-methyl-D-erythritol kinase
MIFLASAKINLNLQITGKDKKDGYHFLKSVFDPVSLYDLIDIETFNTPKIRVKDALGRLGLKQEKNLVYKAAVLLQKESKICLGADITLYKHIPDGAGLGGGSSDAAAVLKGLNRLWRINYPAKKLKKLAFKLGSDVPFFIDGKPSLISGKGNIIKRIMRKQLYWYVIVVKKGVKVNTREAYKWYDIDNKLTLSQNSNILSLRLMREPKNPLLHLSVFNDFEESVFRRKKVLKKVKETLLKCRNAAAAGMSGSGASVFALFTKKKDAHACYLKSRKSFRGSFICLAHSI